MFGSVEGTSVFVIILVGILGFVIYFLPSYIAHKRKHPSFGAILIINLLFGWTLLGWVGSLIWALSSPPAPTNVQIYQEQKISQNVNVPPASIPPSSTPPSVSGSGTNFCPNCGKKTDHAGSFCISCGAKIKSPVEVGSSPNAAPSGPSASSKPGAPRVPDTVDEYRRRLEAFRAAKDSIAASRKCHVCGQYNGFFKLCPICRRFDRRPDLIERYLGPQDYTTAGIILALVNALCFLGFLGTWASAFGLRLVLGEQAAGITILFGVFFLFGGLTAYGFTLDKIKRWRAIHGQWPQGAQLVRIGMWIYIGLPVLAIIIFSIARHSVSR